MLSMGLRAYTRVTENTLMRVISSPMSLTLLYIVRVDQALFALLGSFLELVIMGFSGNTFQYFK